MLLSAITFESQVAFATEDGPTAIARGDFNGDGSLDIVNINQRSDTASVFLNDTSGGFSTSDFDLASDYSTYVYARDIEAGDFNGDGHLDLALIYVSGWNNAVNGFVTVYENDGTGGFSEAGTQVIGYLPQWTTVGDFDQDGISDIAVSHSSGNLISIGVNDGDGEFSFSEYQLSVSVHEIQVGDFNADGHVDLAVATGRFATTSGAAILLNNGDATFTADLYSHYRYGYGFKISVGDFNADGLDDLAVTNPQSYVVIAMISDGSGGYSRSEFSMGYVTVTNADFDDDGDVDLAFGYQNLNAVSFLLNDGHGDFSERADFGGLSYDSDLLISGDFDNDGLFDLAGLDFLGDSMWTMTNNTTFAGVTYNLINDISNLNIRGNLTDSMISRIASAQSLHEQEHYAAAKRELEIVDRQLSAMVTSGRLNNFWVDPILDDLGATLRLA